MTQPAPQQPTQQTPTAAPTVPTASGEEGLGSFEANLAKLNEEIRQEGLQAAQAERDQAPDAAQAAQQQPAAQPNADEAYAKAAADRRARLQQLQESSRAKLREKQEREARYRLPDEVSARDKRIAELEAQLNAYVPREHLKDPIGALRALEEAGISPDKLGEAIRERMTDPERYAAQAAQRAVDPKLTALERKLAEQDQIISTFLAQQEQREREYQRQQAQHSFLRTVAADGGSLAAKFLAAEGPDKFMGIVERASARLPDGAGQQALLDTIEEILDTDGRRIYQQMAAIYGPLGHAPSNGTTTPPKPAAAQATTTVTNSIAQERASVVTDDDPMAGMSYDEKVRYLSRQL